MWDLAVREGDYARADSLIRRLSRTPFSGRALDAFARGDSAARARILDEARVSDRPTALLDAAEFIAVRSEEHMSELQSLAYLVCRLLLEKKKKSYQLPASPSRP